MIEQKDKDLMLSESIRLTEVLSKLDPTSKEYEAVLKNLETLTRTRKTNSENALKVIEIVGMAVVNLSGIGLVLGYERLNVITSKAFGMIKRP